MNSYAMSMSNNVHTYNLNGNEVTDFRFEIVGLSHEGRDEAVRRMVVPGLIVFLEREPTNPYDPNAIKVVLGDGVCIGYVDRNLATAFAAALDSGERWECVVDSVDDERDYVLPEVIISARRI